MAKDIHEFDWITGHTFGVQRGSHLLARAQQNS